MLKYTVTVCCLCCYIFAEQLGYLCCQWWSCKFQNGPRSNWSQCLIWSEETRCYRHWETVGPANHVDITVGRWYVAWHIPFDGNNCPRALWLLSAVQCGLSQRFGNNLMNTTKTLRGCLWIPEIMSQFSISGMCWTNKYNPCRLCHKVTFRCQVPQNTSRDLVLLKGQGCCGSKKLIMPVHPVAYILEMHQEVYLLWDSAWINMRLHAEKCTTGQCFSGA